MFCSVLLTILTHVPLILRTVSNMLSTYYLYILNKNLLFNMFIYTIIV